jgi:hypothetical protein
VLNARTYSMVIVLSLEAVARNLCTRPKTRLSGDSMFDAVVVPLQTLHRHVTPRAYLGDSPCSAPRSTKNGAHVRSATSSAVTKRRLSQLVPRARCARRWCGRSRVRARTPTCTASPARGTTRQAAGRTDPSLPLQVLQKQQLRAPATPGQRIAVGSLA